MSANTDGIYEVNLQEHIEKYVWRKYKEEIGFFKNLFFRKNQHYIDIRWGYVDFKHKTEKTYRPLTLQKREVNVKEKELPLYTSEYENKTDKNQKFTFSTSRETTATTSIEIQDSYTIGAETNLEVDLGGLVKFGGGVSGEMSVTNTKGEEHTETQTWNIDTEIEVPSGKRAIAVLELKEVAMVADFEVETIVSLPKGQLPVSIRRISDDKEIKTFWIMNISKIFDPDYIGRTRGRVSVVKDTNKETNKIDIKLKLITHGVCKSVAGKEQRVKVEYKPLISESNTASTSKTEKVETVTTAEVEEKKLESETEDEVINGGKTITGS